MTYRPLDNEKDRATVIRMWREAGWYRPIKERAFDEFLPEARARVAEFNGEAECLVASTPGTIRHLDQDLPFSCVATVTTSRVARKQGLAQNLTARTLAEDATDGALVAGLGMFEQGFYNRLGFGSGSYGRWASFDPAQLRADLKARPPRRLSQDDWAAVHQARLNRWRGHGSCNITGAGLTRGDMGEPDEAFGLGYFGGPEGALSHCLWCRGEGEHGPYRVRLLIFRTHEEFRELMGLLKTLGDQVRSVHLAEPPYIQLQDVICHPFRQATVTEGGRHQARMGCAAWQQFRILDLPGCLAKTHLPCTETLRFNLSLSDPIAERLPDGAPWRGVGGEYLVTLGEASAAERGTDPSLPTLTATVNAFTRLWLGVQPATGLAFTDDLQGSPELLEALDRTLRLPQPRPDWDF